MSNTTTVKTRGRPSTKVTGAKRPQRIPMSGLRKRMHIDVEDQDPNFHYAWINDQVDLISRAKRAGFEHVTIAEMPQWGTAPDVDSASPASSLVSIKVNATTTAYLMKQPMEYYEEDRAAINALVDAREADMKKSLNSGQNGTYGKVEIS